MKSFVRRDATSRAIRIALACSASIIATAPTWAQTPPEPSAVEADGEIIVTSSRPIAESEAAALQIQRNSDSLVSVVASDSVGRLPDQNIAEAAARLPGIAVESDQGQPRYVSVRGAPKNWTTLSFDGINIVSPEGRDARFDSIPSAIAAQIIVSKAVTAEMPGETVAGNINVVTRSAFDYSGFHVASKLGYGVAEYSSRPQYEASAVVSNRFKAGDGEIGILLSGSYFQRDMVTDNFETDWERLPRDQRPGAETRLWGGEMENKLYRLTRKNWSVSGRLDWKPDNDNTLSLRSIYTIFTDNEARDNYRFDADQFENNLSNATAACATTVNPTPTTSGYGDVCIGNTPLQGTLYGIRIRQRSTLRAYKQSIFTNSFEGSHAFGDGWKLNWVGNYTESKDDRTVTGEASWQSPSVAASPTVAYDFTDPNRSILRLFNTTVLTGPTRYQAGTAVTAVDTFAKPLNGFTTLDAIDTTKAYTGKVVLTRDTEFMGVGATFKAGFQFDQRTKVADERQISLTAAQYATVGMPTDYNQFSTDQAFMGKIPMTYTFRYFDVDKMAAVGRAARANFTPAPLTENNYDVQEQVYAGYLMGTLRPEWGSVIAGVRVEHVKNRGIAVATIGTAAPALVTARAEQTFVFPSLHANYNIDDTKKLRISFNSGAARADYDQLRPNVVVSDVNQTISGGNPSVKPERAYGVDAYFEWYLRPQGYLSIGVFAKRIEDVLYTQRRIFNSNALDSNGVDRSGYTFSGITNAGGGRLFGVEAAAQLQLEPWTDNLGLPDWMGGFGISGNITFNDSQVTKPEYIGATFGRVPQRSVRLPNTSDVVYNVGPYYEKYGLSMKLSYKYRSKWLDAIADDETDGGDGYWAPDDELDFSTRYAVSRNFEVYFDATNLLNRPGRRFVDPSGIYAAKGYTSTGPLNIYTSEWEQFGRRYAGGIRVNF